MIVKSYDFNKLKKNWKKLYLFYGNNNGYKSEIIEELWKIIISDEIALQAEGISNTILSLPKREVHNEK